MHAEKVLVDFKNGRDDDRDGKVFLDEAVVEREVLFNVFLVIISIPDIGTRITRERQIKTMRTCNPRRKTLRRMANLAPRVRLFSWQGGSRALSRRRVGVFVPDR